MSHVRIPRNVFIKYYADVTLSILLSLIDWFGRFNCKLSFWSFLWKIHFFPMIIGVLRNHWPPTSNQSPTTSPLTQLICSENQMTGFYMMGTLVIKGLTLPQVLEHQWKEMCIFADLGCKCKFTWFQPCQYWKHCFFIEALVCSLHSL